MNVLEAILDAAETEADEYSQFVNAAIAEVREVIAAREMSGAELLAAAIADAEELAAEAELLAAAIADDEERKAARASRFFDSMLA